MRGILEHGRRSRRRWVILGLVLALILAGAASGRGMSAFHGTTKQHSKVSFRATGKSVVGFKTSVWSLCNSATGPKSEYMWFAVNDEKQIPVKNGRFETTYTGDYAALNGSHITVSGRISGGSANGNVKVSFTTSLGIQPGTGNLYIAACSGRTTWSAKSG